MDICFSVVEPHFAGAAGCLLSVRGSAWMCAPGQYGAHANDWDTGQQVSQRLVPANEQVLAWLARLPGPDAVAYEAGPTGFGLARALTAAGSRRAGTRVPDMLASALYEIFTGTREGDLEIRKAIYYVWRTSPAQRSKTMRLLSTQDTGRRHFLAAFLNVMTRAGFRLFPESAKSRGWRYSFAAGISFATWLLWLARYSVLREPNRENLA